MKNILFLLTVSASALSCGDDSTTALENAKVADIAGSTIDETPKSPCALVTEAELAELLGLPTTISAAIKDVVRTYPSCFFTWESHPYAITKTFGGKDVVLNYPTEVSIVRVDNATESMFETSAKVYRDGEAVDGIGDRAMWGDQLSQITFLAKGTMIHLGVKKSGNAAENKAIALKIAEVIIGNL